VVYFIHQVIDVGADMNVTHVEQGDSGGRIRKVQGDERRRSLVLAAYHLIAEKGFEQLRTREVAARVGVNIATLHYYFAGKEVLIQGVVDHLLDLFRTAPVPSLVPEHATPLGQIRAMFLTIQYRLQEMPEMFIVLTELILRSLRDTSIKQSLKKLDDSWHAYLKQVITDGLQQGVFRDNLDPDSTATELIILLKGITYHHITSSRAFDFDLILKDVERLLLR
jgi:AcrR family transcriptional regulator